MKPKNKLASISASALVGMSKDNRFTSIIPGLRNVLAEPAKCTGCARNQSGFGGVRSSNVKAREANNVLYAISRLGAKKKQELKKLLSTKHIRVVYTNSNGKRVQLTF